MQNRALNLLKLSLLLSLNFQSTITVNNNIESEYHEANRYTVKHTKDEVIDNIISPISNYISQLTNKTLKLDKDKLKELFIILNKIANNKYYASVVSSKEEFKNLLLKLISIVDEDIASNKYNLNEKPILFKAINQGNLSLIRFLIEIGIDINTQDRNGNTILIELINNRTEIFPKTSNLIRTKNQKDLEIFKLLLESGANINMQNNNGITPLMAAVIKGQVILNRTHKDGTKYIQRIPQSLCLEIANLLVSYSANINIQDNNEFSALMHAINNKNIEFTDFLLNLNANTLLKNNNNQTILEQAMATNDAKIINMLKIESAIKEFAEL